jgi:hypothetical protein
MGTISLKPKEQGHVQDGRWTFQVDLPKPRDYKFEERLYYSGTPSDYPLDLTRLR